MRKQKTDELKRERKQRRPLEGIRILECASYHAGPGGSAILGDLGAQVIKVEQPGDGDPIRSLMRIGSIPFEIPVRRNLFCEGANRNKKSITLNLKTEKGRQILYVLVQQSDVFLHNMRPTAVKTLKIRYQDLSPIQPKLIYASVSAYGSKGPDRERGGFDYQGQARSGLMYAMGEPGMPPVVSQFGLVDQVTAIMVSHQILTALFMRERNGIGQEVEVSILGSAIFLNYFNALITHLGSGRVPRHDRRREHPMRNYYQCRDGCWLMMTLTPPDRFWPGLCQALGHTELAHDPRFQKDDDRLAQAEYLVELFDRIFATRPREEWLKIFADYDLFCCAINTAEELALDPQVLENGYLKDFDHPTLGRKMIPGYPVHFSQATAGTRSAAPDLGEHTEEVLRNLCGLTVNEIKVLRREGVI
jgi:formyl-CoA transferase